MKDSFKLYSARTELVHLFTENLSCADPEGDFTPSETVK